MRKSVGKCSSDASLDTIFMTSAEAEISLNSPAEPVNLTLQSTVDMIRAIFPAFFAQDG